jgi:beta-lactamase superfamily II metal-dependent hydrolase
MHELKVAFLNVGHGEFIYAVTPNGSTLVIDVGTGEHLVPSAFLRNVPKISELQISHPHTDHFDDIMAISTKPFLSFTCPDVAGFSDEAIGWKKGDKGKIDTLRELQQTRPSLPFLMCEPNGFIYKVWPPTEVDSDDPNTASLVTILSYQGVTILLGGDLPAKGWESLLTTKKDFVAAAAATTIFKAPHHGREDSCCEALLAWMVPKLCIISDKPLDKDKKNAAAAKWYEERSLGCDVVGSKGKRKVLTTRNDGSVFISVGEQGKLSVYPHTEWKN